MPGAWPWFIQKPIQTGFQITPPPFAHGVLHGVQLIRNDGVAEPIASQQNDA
jgi:hypothetical protein